VVHFELIAGDNDFAYTFQKTPPLIFHCAQAAPTRYRDSSPVVTIGRYGYGSLPSAWFCRRRCGLGRVRIVVLNYAQFFPLPARLLVSLSNRHSSAPDLHRPQAAATHAGGPSIRHYRNILVFGLFSVLVFTEFTI